MSQKPIVISTVKRFKIIEAHQVGKQTIKIKAVPDGKYLLSESETGVAPKIKLKRIGKNLLINIEGDDESQPQIIIENYYDHPGKLVAPGPTGALQSYASVEGIAGLQPAALIEGPALEFAPAGASVFDIKTLSVAETVLWSLGSLAVGTGIGFLIGHNHHHRHGEKKINAPVITGIHDNEGTITGVVGHGDKTNDARPVFSGTGSSPGHRIEIWDNGVKIGDTLVNAEGRWEFRPLQPLSEGQHSFSAIEMDGSGHISAPSAPWDMILDATPPEQPLLESIIDHVAGGTEGDIARDDIGMTNDARPSLKGSAEPGSLITIFDGGIPIASIHTDADGKWQWQPPAPLSEGEHRFSITATDVVGNVSIPSAPFVITVDTQAPLQASIDTIQDNVTGGTEGNIARDNIGLTNDARPVLQGTAEPDSLVIIYDNDIPVASLIADSNGKWQWQPGKDLADGQHALKITASDVAGNISIPSAPFIINVDTLKPDQPILEAIQDNVTGGVVGDITNDGTGLTNDARPVLRGAAEPGTLVIIYDGENAIASVAADNNGQWTWQPEGDMAQGRHNLTVTATDPAGNVSDRSAPYVITIDSIRPEQPLIEAVQDNVSGGTEGDIINDGIGLTNDARPVLSGAAEPGTLVIIYDGENAIASVAADSNGQWTWQPEGDMAQGRHNLTVTATDPAGNASDRSAPYVITIDSIRPEQPLIEAVQDNVSGGTEGDITNDGIGLTNDARPVLRGAAEPGTLVIIYDGENAIASVAADSNGQWTWQPEGDMAQGRHNLTVTATDPAGNVSERSAPYVITIDSIKPEQPLIEAVEDNVPGGVEGGNDIGNGGLTNDPRPLWKGSAEPFSVVHIFDAANQLIGTAISDADGKWQWRPDNPLPEGKNIFTVTATDAAGNISDRSAQWSIDVDTVKPLAPAIKQVLDNVPGGIEGGKDIGNGGLTNDGRPLLKGVAEANSIVRFYDADRKIIGSVTADASGNWQWRPDSNLPEGRSAITLTATDAAGNISDNSAQWIVNIDTIKPDAPTIRQVLDNVAGGIEGGNDIGNGGLTNDNRPILKGNAEANSVVRFYNAAQQLIGSAITDAGGNWQWRPDSTLPEGQSVFTMTATDAAGNISDSSAKWIITVDTVKPVNNDFTIGSIDDGALWSDKTTNDARPVLSGTGEKDALVIIYQNGRKVGSTSVDSLGNWSWRPEVALNDGNYAFTVTLTDPAGNTSAETAIPVNVTVDTTPPVAKAIVEAITHESGNGTNGKLFISDYTGAGRVISGNVQGTVASNERIQISTDNGLTWHDVQRDSQGGWYWMDPLEHQSNWVLQTRIIDNLNRTSPVEKHDIIIDTSTPDAPYELSYQGQNATVHFSGNQTEKGGQVSIKVGGHYYLFPITDEDIAKGYITVTLPDSAVMNDEALAAVVNKAGRTSDYRDVSLPKAIDFKTYNGEYYFKAGTVVDGVLFDSDGHYHQNDAYTGGTSQGWVMHFWNVASLYLNKDELGTKFIEFNTRTFNQAGTINIRFYDKDDNLIHTWPSFNSDGKEIVHISYKSDVPIYRVEFDNSVGDRNLAVMDFNIMRSYTHLPDEKFVIDTQSDFIPGTDKNDIFDIENVADLAHLKALTGGLGVDTLRLTGANQTLNFSQFADKISSVEVIDITGSGKNTLTLGLGEVLNMGVRDLFVADGKNQLMVKGNAGDKVELSDILPSGTDIGDWKQSSGTVEVGGIKYNVFQHTGIDAEVLIQQGIQTDLINH